MKVVEELNSPPFFFAKICGVFGRFCINNTHLKSADTGLPCLAFVSHFIRMSTAYSLYLLGAVVMSATFQETGLE